MAVITNGTAILGLGDLGALAGKPVMEGKGVLFKKFADIDVFDIEVNENLEEIICLAAIAPTFGGINLEDIRPRMFRYRARPASRWISRFSMMTSTAPPSSLPPA